jgi:rod shape-determining protein MreC
MAVVAPDGIVGVVKNVTAHYSTVIPVLNNKLQISVVHKKTGYFGSLVWDGKDHKQANVNEIPIHAGMMPGDSIVTSGYSALFPPGEMVGKIVSIADQKGGSFSTLRIALSTDFKRLSRVYIIHNRGSEEIRNLELLNDDQ